MRSPRTPRSPDHRPGLGRAGEAAAAELYGRDGFTVVARNLRTTLGELDLVVRRRDLLVAVEVKTRRGVGAPERAVDDAELARRRDALIAVARVLAPELARPRLRIDVVAVRWFDESPPEVRAFPGAEFRPGRGPPAPWHRRCGPTRDAAEVPAVRRTPAPRRRCPQPRPRFGKAARAADKQIAPSPNPPMATLAQQIIPKRKLMLIASETLLLSAIIAAGTSLPPLGAFDFAAAEQASLIRMLLSCLTVGILCQASLSYNDLYDWNLSQNRSELPNRLLHSGGYALVMLSALVFVFPGLFHFPGLRVQTWPLILVVLVAFLLVYAWRWGFHWFFYKWNFGERVAILGHGAIADETAQLIRSHPVSGFEVVGLIRSDPTDTRTYTTDVLGDQSHVRDLVDEHRIARIVVALSDRRGKLPVNELLMCRLAGVKVEEREMMYERIHGKIALEGLRPSYLIFGAGFSQPPAAIAIKRTLDILVSAVGLIVSLPISLLAVLLIKLDSRGPVFFRQPRVGQDGVQFNVLKFRTMRHDAEKQTGPVWAKANDDRITRVGRVLRVTRIDEIPQMLNVLAGHMSFVGPRPERPFFVEELSQKIDFYPLRLTVKPGITGWAQVRHSYGASVEDAKEKLRYDLYYIKNMSPLFDLNIILRTVGVVLFGKGAR